MSARRQRGAPVGSTGPGGWWILRAVRRIAWALPILVAATGVASCGGSDPVTPPGDDPKEGPPTLTITSAPSLQDTIDALGSGPLIVRVLDGFGSPLTGTSVVFGGDNLDVGAPGLVPDQSVVSAITDSRGEAAVDLRFGTETGDGAIVVTVTTLQLSDTLAFTVLPGAAHSVSFSPTELTVVVGEEFNASLSATDRHGNTVGNAYPVSVSSGPLTVHDGVFVGTKPGVATIGATVAGVQYTGTVTILPDGQVALLQGSQIRIVRFNGTDSRTLAFSAPSVREPSIDWSRDGTRLVVGGTTGFKVVDVATGQGLFTPWSSEAGGSVIWPRFTANGDTVYYETYNGFTWETRRMGIHGESPTVIVPAPDISHSNGMPSLSPDGTRMVFTSDLEQTNKYLLRVMNLGTGATSTINVEGVTPVWALKGDLIGFTELGLVGAVSPSGTGLKSYYLGWGKGVTWSPDGEWLVGLRGGAVEIVEIATGQVLRLPHLGSNLSAIAWHP